MQQQPGANSAAAPTFWGTVLGTMIGIFGCFIASLVLAVCAFVAFFAMLGPQIGNIFSRITNGLGAP